MPYQAIYLINKHGVAEHVTLSYFSSLFPSLDPKLKLHMAENVSFKRKGWGSYRCRLINFFSLQTEDKCCIGWLNPGPTLRRFWGGFSESKGLGAGDPVHFPPWSLLGRGLNNKALFTELPGVPCIQTQVPCPSTPLVYAVLTWPAATGVYLTPPLSPCPAVVWKPTPTLSLIF